MKTDEIIILIALLGFCIAGIWLAIKTKQGRYLTLFALSMAALILFDMTVRGHIQKASLKGFDTETEIETVPQRQLDNVESAQKVNESYLVQIKALLALKESVDNNSQNTARFAEINKLNNDLQRLQKQYDDITSQILPLEKVQSDAATEAKIFGSMPGDWRVKSETATTQLQPLYIKRNEITAEITKTSTTLNELSSKTPAAGP